MDGNLTQIILAVLALFAAAGLCFRFVSRRSKSTNTTQTGNKVGGDLAGRDITKKM